MREEEFFIKPDTSPKVELAPGVRTSILTGLDGNGMMMVLTEIEPGVTVPAHKHPQEQIGMVYSGKAEMTIAGRTKVIEKGDFCHMPPDVEHQATCLGDGPFVMLDIFYPAREDFLEKMKD